MGRSQGRVRIARGIAASLGALLAAGCAPSLRVLTGTTERAPLHVEVRATAADESTRVALRFESRSDEPVAVDLDQVAVRTGSGAVLRALGKLQRFREGASGSASMRRVPNELVVVDPRGKLEVEVELPPLPERVPLSLQVPSLHRLSIEGQRPLPPMQVPLRLDDKASAEASRMYDPFEE